MEDTVETSPGLLQIEKENQLCEIVYTYNPSTQEVETGGARVQGQPDLCSETLSQKQKKKKIERASKSYYFVTTQ
jgi:hypothetical protein